MPLYRKYRPAELGEVVGQDKIVQTLKKLEANGLGGRGYWITGRSGTGKTTVALIIGAKITQDQAGICETTGRELSRSMLQNFVNQYKIYGKPFIGAGYCLIVNEAHGLQKPTIEVLLNELEALPDYVTIIFTTTRDGNDLFEEQLDSTPFASRCINLNLKVSGNRTVFAKRLKEIAETEGMDNNQPLTKYERLLQDNQGNFRTILNIIESGGLL